MKKESPVVYVDEILKEVIPSFLEEVNKDMNQLEHFASSQDYEALKKLSHTLTGDCGSYGFAPLSSLAGTLHLASEHQDDQKITEMIQKMKNYLSSVQVHYRQES